MSQVEVQPHGLPKTDLGFLGWDHALPMYRPFLSYSELGSMFDEGPTKLHDAVSSVLGLDELTAAQNALRNARLSRQKDVKAALAHRDEIIGVLEGLDDERARQCVGALRGDTPDLDTVERVATAGHPVDASGELARLRRIVGLQIPERDAVRAAATSLADAQRAVTELAGTTDDAMLRSADLLEMALAHIADYPSDNCPVCGTEGTVDAAWQARTREQVDEQRRLAHLAQRERTRLASAIRTAQGLPGDVPSAVQEARGLLDIEPVIAAWRPWVALVDETDPVRLASGLEATIDAVVTSLNDLTVHAEVEIAKREDAWRPIASTLAAWVAQARPAFTAAVRIDDLTKAESWLKAAGGEIRNDRFAPIADQSMAIWKILRQRSNVELGRIELKGSGAQRKVTLDVTVDGVPGAALGVMSQGELHALALSLFFPRATMEESPFRFVVVDDPVQSMDPAKVDGLARVLEDAARTRQVVVFTHDDRLPEAVRRLGIDARILEVSRREGSEVELRPALTPIERHIQDARSLVNTDDLPLDVARRVVPGFCRLAIEAGCVEATRRRRIGQRRVSRRRRGSSEVGHAPHWVRCPCAFRRLRSRRRRSLAYQLGIRPLQGRRLPGCEQGLPRRLHGRSRVARPRLRSAGARAVGDEMSQGDPLELARMVTLRDGPTLVGVWPRASALLARQAVEDAMAAVLAVTGAGRGAVCQPSSSALPSRVRPRRARRAHVVPVGHVVASVPSPPVRAHADGGRDQWVDR